ncbi:hypothetical protein VWY34_16225 [Phaeobacter sp. JH20_02]|uniref:hypothetical protein n=1 Tax=unclassified Phaeobacter TaxID=2621772 RepID=UPI003A88B139
MNDTASTGLAHCSLMILLAAGVAVFALLDHGGSYGEQPGSLAHLTSAAQR